MAGCLLASKDANMSATYVPLCSHCLSRSASTSPREHQAYRYATQQEQHSSAWLSVMQHWVAGPARKECQSGT